MFGLPRLALPPIVARKGRATNTAPRKGSILDNSKAIPVVASEVSVTDSDAPKVVPDYEQLYESQKAETGRLNALLTAAKISNSSAPKSVQPSMTAQKARAMVGELAWLKMSRDERLISIGVDPKSVTNEGLQKIFGRGNDGSIGKDLMKTSPSRYAQLRQASLALNLYAA
jgi:hypothetical protein